MKNLIKQTFFSLEKEKQNDFFI